MQYIDEYQSSLGRLTLASDGQDPGPLPKLSPKGSEFRQAVWRK